MKKVKFNLKEEYKKLKYKLPDFNELNNEFELNTIKNKNFLLRQIRRRINEKVIFYCKILEGLLYPNTSDIIGMHEIMSFSEVEKKKLSDFYKKLMVFERQSLKLDVNPNNEEDIKYINEIFKSWKKFKEEMINITEKMQASWKKEEPVTKDVYFG